MHLIVTRPTQQTADWLTALQAAGHSTSHLPLIDIAAADGAADDAAWQAALESAQPWRAIMFVSSNACAYFYKKNSASPPARYEKFAINLIVNPASLRIWATGPGTVLALQAAGVPRSKIDAPAHDAEQFDSEALWQVVQHQIQPASRVLIVRGRDVGTTGSSRDWLAQQIQERGGQASSLVVYERRAPRLTQVQHEQSQAWLQDGSVWLFSSSQAVRHLPQALDASQGICICTHERIAQEAKTRGFAVVCTSRPTVQDVVASIKSWHA
jgi:uroporphyrinogen-III synthase